MSGNCLICETPIAPFMSFGRMPIANGFLTPAEFDREYFFDLAVGFCARCGMVQLTNLVDRERMFHENYAFFSSTSARMAAHFQTFAEDVLRNHLPAGDPFVVEIGSNDGIMLQHFAKAGVRHLGIEPSANVARVASDKGVRTISEFFDADLARRIVAEHGQADAFLGANVMCHIPYLHSVWEGIEILLKPDGLVLFEDPYLGDIVEKTSYDQIYDEHAFYFSVASVGELAGRHGLELVDVQPQAVHGGSMRYVLARRGRRPASAAVVRQRAMEESLGLRRPATYDRLRSNIERSRDELRSLLCDLKARRRRVVGYAATSKSTTVTNYCRITPELVEYITDTTPIKQGKFSPGTHIPVRSHDEFASNYPEYALLFGWNHRDEIVEKEREFRMSGGKWVEYVPVVRVV